MKKLTVITGTTASGKSDIAVELAKSFNAEIVSADSRQVYKGLDLGSGKIMNEEMQGIPHHLLDIAMPDDFFSLAHFMKLAYEAIDEIHERGNRAFLVGGTGLYINSVVDGYELHDEKPDLTLRKQIEERPLEELIEIVRTADPEAFERIDLKNKRRVERAAEKAMSGRVTDKPNKPRYKTLMIGVTWPRSELYERIRIRLDRRLEQGMIDEVRSLRENGVSDGFLYKLGLEYRYIFMYLRGEFDSYEAFYDKLFMEIRHLAKEQMTWFRKRKDIHWIDMESDPVSEASELIEGFYALEDESDL